MTGESPAGTGENGRSGRNVLIVVNPRSGSYEGRHLHDALHRVAAEGVLRCDLYEIGEVEDARDRIRAALDQGYDLIVAACGDGTVSLVVAEVMGHDIPIGIVPLGTGNAMARELGIPKRPEAALRLLTGDLHTRTVDAMRAGGRHYLLAIGVGVSPTVMRRTSGAAKRRFGILAYVWHVIRELRGSDRRTFSLTIDGRRRRVRCTEIEILNAANLGGTILTWHPAASLSDARLLVCIVRARTVAHYARLAWSMLLRREQPDHMECVHAERSVRIETPEPLPVQGDGELIGSTPIEVVVVPQSVRVVVPERSESEASARPPRGMHGGEKVGRQSLTQMLSRQPRLCAWSEGLRDLLHRTYGLLGTAKQRVADMLHGTWLGHPLHPLLMVLPMGTWLLVAVLDGIEALTGKRRLDPAAETLLGAGLLAAVPTAEAGATDWMHSEGAAQPVGLTHALLNLASLPFFALSLLARLLGRRTLGRWLTLPGLALAGAAGYLGGELAYDLRMGMNHAPRPHLPTEFTPVLPDDHLPEGRPVRVQVGDTPVVLVRQAERVHAIVATCAHLGGPLNEGHIEDGAIVCPWHGSRYSLEDGRLLNGPSVYDQPTLEARVREGEIQVRVSPPQVPCD